MNRCKHYLDSIETDSNDSYKEAVEHANNCSDCSYDKKLHEEMLHVLNNLSEPEYPNNLHELVYNAAVDKNSSTNDEQDFLSNVAIWLLRPLEIAAPIACVFMLICMIQLNSNTSDDKLLSKAPNIKVISKTENQNQVINTEGLEKVSPDEVKEFLAKLDEFQKLHPETNNQQPYNNINIRLVTDK